MNEKNPKLKEIEELFQSKEAENMSSEEAAGLLEQVSLKDIYSMRLSVEKKLLLADLKFGKDVLKEAAVDKAAFVYEGEKIYTLSGKNVIKLCFMEEEQGFLVITGLMKILLFERYTVYFEDGQGKQYNFCKTHADTAPQQFIGKELKGEQWFCVKIPYDKKAKLKLKIFLQFGEGEKILLNPSCKLFFPTADVFPSNYGIYRDIILQIKGKALVMTPYTKKQHKELEKAYEKDLKAHKENEVLKYRRAYFFHKPFLKKEIWLILDRAGKADDNGEHLFKYIMKEQLKDKKVYYVIDESCPDYERMKKIGKVLPLGSFKHKLCFLLSSKVISSQFNPYVFKPFGEKGPLLQDLFSYQSVFLQHGVTQNDLSGFFSRKTKNFKLFVTVGEREQASLLQDCYGYTEKEVKVTGFPRFDYLKEHEKEKTKKILIMPSWRRSIKESYDENTASVYYEGFRNTSYFQFYNTLINDKRLLDCMRDQGYTGAFALHPVHYKQYVDFNQNDCFTILGEDFNYQQQFISSAVMVTDYSSVAFDFAYLKKPVIYARFDEEEFYEGQRYGHGYFDVYKDGFGPVCRNLEDTVDKLIQYIKNDCLPEEKYVKRVDDFYAYQDAGNCKRVLDAILQL